MTKILVTLSFACILMACSKSHTITEAAPFKNTVETNSKFHINLPEDHNTGYVWLMDSQYDTNVLDYMNSVWHGNEKGVDFNFEARKKGETTLKFTLIKYRDTLEMKQFMIEVK